MNVAIPSVLQAYTAGKRSVEATGATVADLLRDLDAKYPGIRFRMVNEADVLRPHIRVFVNRDQVDDLAQGLSPGDDVVILQALSGG
jgi:molybdopterin converting factor small subunit